MAKKQAHGSDPRTELKLPLRVNVVAPPPGVLFCVQGKLGEFLSQTPSTGADLVFDVEVRALLGADGDRPRLLGAVVQGPPAQRFLYVCSGTCAGETDTCWTRRAKVSLTGITSALIGAMKAGATLSATIRGTAKDGGPACASVALLGAGWQWTAR